MKAKFLGLLFLFNLPAHVSAQEFDQQWLKLLRYNKSFTGYKSEVDNPEYFLSPKGKNDPAAELAASIQHFALPLKHFKDPNQHPRCLFPGRFLYLKRKGKVAETFDPLLCKEYQTFHNKIKLQSVSLIFSSYFINKPASAFGHTLLKLNKEDPLTGDLKSYGVDFSAQVTTSNPLLYGLFGIFGGFYGRFSLLPYFLKLREYNDFESRDLWEFELNFAPAELELFVAHLWDMNLALFDYFYFTENCSYHITRFIDAIKPEWKLIDELYKIVIPVDTLVPLIEKKHITRGIYYRSSVEKRVQGQLKDLNPKEIEYVNESFDDLKLKKDSTLKDKARALDALIEFTDYKYPSELLLSQSNKIHDFKREILMARSQLPTGNSIVPKKVKKDSFNYAHLPRKYGFGYTGGDRHGISLDHRFSLHNTLEPNGDIYSNFSLEMGKTSLYYDQDLKQLNFNYFEVALVEALRPMTALEKRLSWQFNFGIQNLNSTISPYLNFALGPSFNLWKSNLSIFVNSENSHFLNQRWKRKNWLGLHLQWLMQQGNIGFKLNYKRMRNLITKLNNVEVIRAEFNYNFFSNMQWVLAGSKQLSTEQISSKINFYY